MKNRLNLILHRAYQKIKQILLADAKKKCYNHAQSKHIQNKIKDNNDQLYFTKNEKN